MDAEFLERARRRRERIVGGVARSHQELDDVDQMFWTKATPSERLGAIWQLALDAMAIQPEKDASPGLQGPAFGTRSR